MLNLEVVTNYQQLIIIRRLALFIWPIKFRFILSRGQVQYMLQQFFNLNYLKRRLSNSEQLFLIVDKKKYIGFASIKRISDTTIKLQQLFFHPDYQNIGVAKWVMENLGLQCQQLEITMNKNNKQALRSAYKNCFRLRRSICIDIGCGFIMDDYVLVKYL